MAAEHKNKGSNKSGAAGKSDSNAKKQHQQSNGPKHSEPDPSASNKKQPAGNRPQASVKNAGSKSSYTLAEKVVNGFLTVVGAVLTLSAFYLAYSGQLTILQAKGSKGSILKSLDTYAGKLEYTAKYWTLGLLWLYFQGHVVMWKRGTSKAHNPLSGNESLIEAEKNVFTNSIEQFVMLIVSQTTAIAYLSPIQVLNVIPVLNAFHLVGRIFFWIGYPKFRTFGFVTSTLPATVAIWFATYHFVANYLNLNPVSLFQLNLPDRLTITK